MESTLVMAAKNNTDLLMFGFSVNPASYQMVNPVLIIFGGMLLIRYIHFYQDFIYLTSLLLEFCWLLWGYL
ncbi:hypothetical protein M973_04435 [Francisella orientalis LADL 07-285A]|nr:hypothetical protein M973_04435 [Francisella orientalis LADL 07-285A]